MKVSANQAILLLCAFVAAVLATAFLSTPHSPIHVIAGEDSVVTWVSGTLLTCMAVLSLAIGMRSRWSPWVFLFAFFLILSLDERFMFHEKLKERIIFSSAGTSQWHYEMPVIGGGVIGLLMSWILWKNLEGANRLMLILAVVFGAQSLVIDVMAGSVVLEECCKLVAELLLVCALIRRLTDTA